MPSRSEMFKALKEDYPTVIDDHINMMLDLYESNPRIIEDMIKQEKQKLGTKRAPDVKRQLTVKEQDELFQIHQQRLESEGEKKHGFGSSWVVKEEPQPEA